MKNDIPSGSEQHDSAADKPAELVETGNSPGREAPEATVCLLDDDASVVKATARLVRAAGWEVETFTDPHAFLQYAQRRQPPVAVIDILMPAMTGLEVQTRLRSIAPATRVIVLTSKDDPAVRAKAMESGAIAFILKPADGEEFLNWIRGALDGNAEAVLPSPKT